MPDEIHGDMPPAVFAPPLRRRSGGTMLLALLVAFLLGAAGIAYAVWQGLIPLPQAPGPATAPASAPAPVLVPNTLATPVAPAAPPAIAADVAVAQNALEARVATLSARIDALTLQAQAAAGNAGRAEALLVAFATRRALDRGAPLGPLEDQLRLRFGDAQPNAVATVIAAARQPVTLDQLVAGLDNLSASLTRTPDGGSAWARLQREISNLFVIRHDDAPSPAPQIQLQRARILLESGQTEDAIAQVGQLPGASVATDWFTAARRYDDARRALDVLETTAMLGNPQARAPGSPPATAPRAPVSAGTGPAA